MVTAALGPRPARRRPRGGMLELAHRTGFLNDLDPVWNEWMQWFTEVPETHTSLGALRVLPFAEPESLVDHRRGHGARRRRAPAGGARTSRSRPSRGAVHPLGLPRAARDRRLLRLRPRPRPGARRSDQRDPRRVHRDLRAARRRRACRCGADREQAWRDFAGWRVNYDRVLLALCSLVMAPYAPWSSDRSPSSPLRRQRWGPAPAAGAVRSARSEPGIGSGTTAR